MAYLEAHQDKDIQKIVEKLKDMLLPFKVQVERMYKKGTDYVQMNKFFHGVLVRSYMKYTGHTFYKSKMHLLIKNALVAEVSAEHEECLKDYKDLFHVFRVRDLIFVTERVSRMTILRLNELIDQTIIDFDDEGIKLNRNEDYKHESELNLLL